MNGVDTVMEQGGQTDILTDQPTSVQEFHILYETKNNDVLLVIKVLEIVIL